jgi:hypothetical protein
MAKKSDKTEDTKSEKHLAWLAAEQRRIEAATALEAATKEAAQAANDYATEQKAAGKNAAEGPGGVVYIIKSTRKPKDGEPAPEHAYTMQRAQTLRI